MAEIFELNQYQNLAQRTRDASLNLNDERAEYGLGISGEAGEVSDYLKKVLFHKHPVDTNKLKRELGDVLWYIAGIAWTYNLELSEIAEANIEKLRARYPNGFNSIDSQQRKVGDI